jgi:hypothetical protein
VRLAAVVGGVTFAVVLWVGATALLRARPAADYSCVASLHARLESNGAFERVPNGTDWREWTAAEVAAATSSVSPSDCGERNWWKDDLGIGTRRGEKGSVESYLWRKSDSAVFSGLMRPSNKGLQRTRPALPLQPRR